MRGAASRFAVAIAAACLLVAAACAGAHAAGVEMQPTVRMRALKALTKAVEINESMKENYLGKTPEEFQVMVDNFKKFNDDILWPALDETLKILEKQNDPQLADALLALAISYTNFDDERVYFALGEAYLANPEVIAEAIRAYDRQWQGFLYNMVLSSWNDIIYFEGFNDPRVRKGNDVLQGLRAALEADNLLPR